MKKSLSAILSLAMAFSMFSSVAFGASKTSADFSDLKDLDAATKAKFDALISAGVFDGVSEGKFGLKDKMNRAQFAKVAALIFGLKADATTSSFTDVKADDPANGYALPYIEALKAAGITDGYAEGKFNPAGEVTKEQLAAFLIRGAGLDSQAKAHAGVSDKTVSDWAKGYVGLAIEKKVLTSGATGTFDGTSAATRDLLVTGAYEAQQLFKDTNKPAKVSVKEAKATGAKTVQVTLDRDVDTAKATLTLTKGGSTVATTAKWSDDKKVATLTLTETTIKAGDYAVKLGGVTEVDKAEGSFKAEVEKVAKIEFVNANEQIAKDNAVYVKVKASNQYGENASFGAGNYTVYTSSNVGASVKKATDGTLLVKLDTTDKDLTAGLAVIPVNIVENDSRVSASKNFKLGTEVFISKLDLGKPQYSNGKDSISSKGETATYELSLLDQYGNVVGTDSKKYKADDVKLFWNNVYEPNLDYVVETNSDNNLPQLKVKLKNNIEKSGDFNFTVSVQAATATGNVKVNSVKVATKLEIGEASKGVASGDTNIYVPITAYDASGNKLSLEDLTSDENVGRIAITVSGADLATYTVKVNGEDKTAAIQQSGENKGSIKLTKINVNSKGIVAVTAIIATPGANDFKTKTFNVTDVRVPDALKEDSKLATSIAPNAEDAFKLLVRDQNGNTLDKSLDTDNNGNPAGSGVTAHYFVTATAVTPSLDKLTLTQDDGKVINTPAKDKDGAVIPNTYTLKYEGADLETFNKGFKVKSTSTATKDDSIKVEFKVWKKVSNAASEVEVASYVKTVNVADVKNNDLSYEIKSIGSLFNAKDSASVTDTVYFTKETQRAPGSKLSKEVKVIGKNGSGEEVGIPSGLVTSVVVTDNSVAQAAKADNGKWYVIGYKKGTTTLGITYNTPKGDQKYVTASVEVKDESVKVTALTAKSEVTVKSGDNLFLKAEIKATDNYDIAFEKEDAGKYSYILGLTTAVSNVRGTGSVTVDSLGVVTITGTVTSFDVTYYTTSGKSASTAVIVNNAS